MRNLVRICCILSIIVLIYAMIFSEVIASDSNLVGTIELFGNDPGDGNDGGGMNAIKIIIGAILNVARIVGAAVAVCILLVIATKYIIASAGDRADIKKYAVNYVIGAMIFLGASGILTLIRNFFLDATSSEG